MPFFVLFPNNHGFIDSKNIINLKQMYSNPKVFFEKVLLLQLGIINRDLYEQAETSSISFRPFRCTNGDLWHWAYCPRNEG